MTTIAQAIAKIERRLTELEECNVRPEITAVQFRLELDTMRTGVISVEVDIFEDQPMLVPREFNLPNAITHDEFTELCRAALRQLLDRTTLH